VPVFAITRVMYASGRVVEVADPITIPGDRAVRWDEVTL
jgi:GntR family transcriptional regulator